MTDTELEETARRLFDQIPADGTEPDATLKALLCEVFREWGRRDFDAAARFAMPGEGVMPHLPHLVRPGELLLLAAWAGFGESDPELAWQRMHDTAADQETSWTFPFDGSLEAIAVVESIFGKMIDHSLEAAAAAISDHRFRNVALGVLLSRMDDPGQRDDLLQRSLEEQAVRFPVPDFITRSNIDAILSHPDRSMPELSLTARALAGIAAQDPDQAWALLSSLTTRMSNESLGFVSAWGTRQPDEALRFFESLPNEGDLKWLDARLVRRLLPTHPEQAIAYYARMPADARVLFQHSEMGAVHQSLLPSPQWPVVEGMKPGIPTAELVQRLRLALDEHLPRDFVRVHWNAWLDTSR
jgi:hypothetical protein